MRKAKIALIIVILLCVICSAVSLLVSKTIIEPRLDYKSTTIIDGKEVSIVKKTPLTLNNEILDSKNEYMDKLNALVKLNKTNSSKEDLTAELAEVNEISKANAKKMVDLEKIIENYSEYKDFMDATKKFYSDYDVLLNEVYSPSNIEILFKEEITQAEYDAVIASQGNYNNNKIDDAFKIAQQNFVAKFSIK